MAVREKTLAKTKEAHKRFADWVKKQVEKDQKKLDEPKPNLPTRVSQIDQMKEAAATEQLNIQSLQALQQIELTKQKHAYSKKEQSACLIIKSKQSIVNGLPKTMFQVPSTESLYLSNKTQENSRSKFMQKQKFRIIKQEIIDLCNFREKSKIFGSND